jgi:1-acyl-sn-glycerol-3-phosphate acyltransferase
MKEINLFGRFARDLFDPNYEPKIDKPYCSEEEVLEWFDKASSHSGWEAFRNYYQLKIYDLEKVPDGGAMLLTNHSTMFFGDVSPIVYGMYEQRRRAVYGLGDNILRNSDIVKQIGSAFGRNAGIELLKAGKYTLVCPEGIMGACRPWYHRRKVREEQGFKGMGYLKVAYKAEKPIVPIGNVGADETMIIIYPDIKKPVMKLIEALHSLFNNDFTSLLVERGRKAKIIPLPLLPFPLPSTVEAYVGDPIDVREILGDNPSKEDYQELNQKVIRDLQALINHGVKNRKSFLERLIDRF